MHSRERVLKAIEHREPDRVPLKVDFKGEALPNLLRYFNVDDDEHLRRELKADTREVYMSPAKGFARHLSDVSDNVATDLDEFGVGRRWGTTGIHWHYTYHPLQHLELDDYEFPNIDAPGRFDRAREQIEQWKGEYAVIGASRIGLLDHGFALRGFREFIQDLYTRPTFVDRLLDKLLDWKIEVGKRLIELGVDIIGVGDDLGTQTGLIISPQLWQKYFKERCRRWLREFKKRGVFVDFHSDGKMESLIPDLIEFGVDILNPVQPECMDPAELKRLYGDKLTFMGTISVQKTMPFGTREDVREEVLTRLRTVGRGGGLILWPRIIQIDVPPENVEEFYTTATKYGTYPLKI